MVRIPDQHTLGRPQRRSVMSDINVDANAMAAPGRAQAQIGEAVAQAGKSIAGALKAFGDGNDKNAKFEAEIKFQNAALRMDDADRAAERNIAPDGKGHRSAVSDRYYEEGKKFISGLPDDLKPEYDARFRSQLHINGERKAREAEYNQQDKHNIKRLGENFEKFYTDIDADPSDPERLDRNIDRGLSVIDASPLPENRKGELKKEFATGAETRYFEAKRRSIEFLSADPATKPEDIEKAYQDLEGEIRQRSAPDPNNPNDPSAPAGPVGPDGAPLEGKDGKPPSGLAPQSLTIEPSPIARRASVGRPRSSQIAGMVIHETQGSDTAAGNLSWSNKKNTGANYYIDKSGRIIEWAPDTIAMNHAGVGRGGKRDVRPDLGNGNTLSIEIMTRPGEKPNEAQIKAAHALASVKAKEYGFGEKDIEAHGRLAPGHREVTEGTAVVDYIRSNWGGTVSVASGSNQQQPFSSDGLSVNLTAYSPQKSGSKMEGGYAAARPGPDGKAEVRTLADVDAGRSEYVTIAGNSRDYGKSFVIPEISFVDASGQTKTLKNVKAVVHDTGSAFKNAPEGRFDVAIDRDANDKQMAASHSIWKKQGIKFLSEDQAKAVAQTPVNQRGLTQYAGLGGPKDEPGAAEYLKSKFGNQVAAAGGMMAPGMKGTAADVPPNDSWSGPPSSDETGIAPKGRVIDPGAVGDDGIVQNQMRDKMLNDNAGVDGRPVAQPISFGVEVRDQLFPGEDKYFKANPNVAGMAAEDGKVILNPYSKNSADEQKAVAVNEAARVYMQKNGIKPDFKITDEQRKQFDGTPYAKDEQAMRETIAARILSGDPSAKTATPEQQAFVDKELRPNMAATGGNVAQPIALTDDNGAVASGINTQGRIATVLDGIPDSQPLSKLPDDVRGQVLAMFPKDALKERTMPDGTKMSALDAMTVGEVKEALAAPLKDVKRVADASRWVFTDKPRFKYIDEAQRTKLLNQIELDRRNFYQNQEKGELEYIKQFGVPRTDAQGRTLIDRASKVLLPNQTMKLRNKMEAAKWQYEFVRPIENLSDDEIDSHLGLLELSPDDDTQTTMMKGEVKSVAIREADRVRALRMKDPATSVDKSREVQDVNKRVAELKRTYTLGTDKNGNPVANFDETRKALDRRQAWEDLISARIDAQERLLGDTYDREDGTVSRVRILKKAEAIDLIGTARWSTLSEDEQTAHLTRAAQVADERYGKYARRAFNEAVRLVVTGEEGKDLAAGLVQKMVRGENVSSRDLSRYEAIKALSPMDAFLQDKVPGQFPDGTMRPLDGRMMTGWQPPSAALPALMSATATPPSAQAGAMSFPTGQAGMTSQPDIRVLQWVMQDPQRRGPILDERFGAGSTQKLMEFMKPKAAPKSGMPPGMSRGGPIPQSR